MVSLYVSHATLLSIQKVYDMISGGYILQPRKLDKSETSHMPPVTRELWLYILRHVNHSDNGAIARGQGFFNLGIVQDDLSWFSGYRKNIYSKPQLTKSLRRLREASMIETTKATRGIMITVCNYDYYQNPKNYEGNGEGKAKATRKKQKGNTINKNEEITKKVKEIILYLNEKTGRKYLDKTEATKAAINARLSEGWTVEDFKTAIDNQVRDWSGTEYEKYLTPGTLFSPSKFEKYVNNTHNGGDKLSPQDLARARGGHV